MYFNILQLILREGCLCQSLGKVEVDTLIENAGGWQYLPQGLPVLGAEPHLLSQLSLSRHSGVFSLLPASCGHFPNPTGGGMAILPDKANLFPLIEGHNSGTTGMAYDLQHGLLAVRKSRHFAIKGKGAALVKALTFMWHRPLIGR
jgi:hypothetical protein